ncbi:MAG: hypothetical protein M3N31_09295 [Actinomycetota bacterium]|nr:hypothetical protein [Actinomycetota bacterium]
MSNDVTEEPLPHSLSSWADSKERRQARRLSLYVFLATFGVWVLALVTFVYGATGKDQDRLPLPVMMPAFFAIPVGFLAMPLGPILVTSRARIRFQEQRARAETDYALTQVQEDMRLADLVRLNRKQTNEYQLIAQRQARSSHRSSQVASAVGLLILASGSATAIFGPTQSTPRIIAAALTSLGMTLSGYIGRTYLRTYEVTLRQMNWYYGQPLVNSYLLTAERLAEKVPEKQAEIFGEIISVVLARASIDTSEQPLTRSERSPSRAPGRRRANILRMGKEGGDPAPRTVGE